MTHTPLTRSLHAIATFALICGIGLTAMHGPRYAHLTGGGGTLVSQMIPAPDATLRQAAPPASNTATPLAQAEAAAQLSLGLLLIVFGFFLHGLARVREERPVHITVKKTAKKRQKWYWLHMQV